MTIFLRNLPVNYRRFAACTFSSDRVIGGLLASWLVHRNLYILTIDPGTLYRCSKRSARRQLPIDDCVFPSSADVRRIHVKGPVRCYSSKYSSHLSHAIPGYDA